MRIRKHWIVIVTVLLTPSLLWSTEEPQEGRRRTRTQAARPDTTSVSGGDIKIFALRYQEAEGLARIIQTLIPPNEATIAIDERSQSLIVATSPDQMEHIESLVASLDTPPRGQSDIPQMLYRIYMLELPSEHENLKPFAMVLEGTGQLRAAQLLGALEDAEVQIDSLSHEPEDARWQKWELAIEGRAASNESVKRMLDKIPESQMKELRWETEMSTPPATQVPPLPNELTKHIQQLLGGSVQTVGYWFGNLSVPGTVRAPIGPWHFDMEVNRSTQDSQVELEIRVESEWQSGQTAWPILGNTVRSHITKPVIIGYNRESHGTRTMGALVIVPEESPSL